MSESSELTQNFAGHADRRTHARHRIRALAYVELGENNGGIVLNISEGGFAVRAAEPIQQDGLSRLRFQMQYAKQPLEMSGTIAWASDSRKEAGVRFIDPREDALLEIKTWIVQEVSPGNMSKQSPFVRQPLRESTRRNESILETPLSDELAEDETQGNRNDLVVGPAVNPDSKSGFSDPQAPQALAERERFGSTLFPKEAGAAPSARLPVAARPAIRKTENVSLARPAEEVPENWMDFRVQIGKGWTVAALVTFLVAVSFAGGMAVRRGGLIGLWRNADTHPSASAQTENSVPGAAPANAPSKPLQIEIVDSSNQRWTIPASAPAVHAAGSGAGVANSDASPDSSESLEGQSSGLPRTPEHQDADGAPFVPVQKGAAPVLMSLPERSVSASDSVAISSQLSFVAPAGSSPAASQPGKNLQVGQLVNLVDPQYPPDARQKHIEGTVKLHATIGVDGSIKDLQPVSGPPALLPAALTAVREWRYSPTLLNGKPIETQEDISLVFRLPN